MLNVQFSVRSIAAKGNNFRRLPEASCLAGLGSICGKPGSGGDCVSCRPSDDLGEEKSRYGLLGEEQGPWVLLGDLSVLWMENFGEGCLRGMPWEADMDTWTFCLAHTEE